LEFDVKQEEGASQLSAMFDGELPAAECELLSRRLARDEQLRGRWARYALVGAAMRSEPVAAVSGDFSRRVGAAIDGSAVGEHASANSGSGLRRQLSAWRNFALGAGLAAGVAGAAIFLLRSEVLQRNAVLSAYTPTVGRMARPTPVVPAGPISDAGAGAGSAIVAATSSEPLSYVVPLNVGGSSQALPASLANYMVAHSEYSSPLARRGLISALVASDAVETLPADAPVATKAAAASSR
jgi:negative regulator of sigma E activity